MRLRSGDAIYRLNEPSRRRRRASRLVIAVLALMTAERAQAETFEFEGPYAVRVLGQGLEIEISGTFSWALPQQVGVALAEAPLARLVRFDSPGGHIKAAMEVADMIRARNLDTYVGRMCASACTIAFLAGRQRFASETARLGFHQAHGPGLSTAESNRLLQLAYRNYLLPPGFIAHVLRTPPQDFWIPELAELRKVGIVTDIAPNAALAASMASAPTDAHGN